MKTEDVLGRASRTIDLPSGGSITIQLYAVNPLVLSALERSFVNVLVARFDEFAASIAAKPAEPEGDE